MAKPNKPNQLPSYSEAMDEARHAWVAMVLEASKGNYTRAEELTGTDRSNIRRLAERVGLQWVEE